MKVSNTCVCHALIYLQREAGWGGRHWQVEAGKCSWQWRERRWGNVGLKMSGNHGNFCSCVTGAANFLKAMFKKGHGVNLKVMVGISETLDFLVCETPASFRLLRVWVCVSQVFNKHIKRMNGTIVPLLTSCIVSLLAKMSILAGRPLNLMSLFQYFCQSSGDSVNSPFKERGTAMAEIPSSTHRYTQLNQFENTQNKCKAVA